MATPDALDQVVVTGRRWTTTKATPSAQSGIFHRPSVTSLIWAMLDIATVGVATVLAVRFHVVVPSGLHVVSQPSYLFHTTSPSLLLYVAWFGLLLVVFMRSYGLYEPILNRSGLNEQRMTVQATLTSGLLLCGTLYLARAEMVSRIIVVLTVLFTMVLLCTRRAIWRKMVYRRYREGLITRNVLIVGAGRVAHALRNHLESLHHLGFRFKGFVALNEHEAESNDSDIIGDMRNCLALARSLFVDEIFFSVPADKSLVIGIVEEARDLGIDVRVVPDLYDGLAWAAPVEYIGQFPTIPLHRRDLPIGTFLLKRSLDVTGAALAMLMGLPFMLLLVAAIKLDSPGPVFYSAQRIGRKGRTFTCYKFRTMCVGADKQQEGLSGRNERDGVLFKIANDPRITRVGRFLRKYSLDELPQLYNVLRSEMSLVGPASSGGLRGGAVRPIAPAPPRCTARNDGPVAGRGAPGPILQQLYISLDTAYIRNWNLWLDMKILVRTIGVVLSGTGA